MALFDKKSRYAKLTLVETHDWRGRAVLALPIPTARPRRIAGIHLRKQAERLDHVAAALLRDPYGFWRIAEANDAMTADAIAEVDELKIPSR